MTDPSAKSLDRQLRRLEARETEAAGVLAALRDRNEEAWRELLDRIWLDTSLRRYQLRSCRQKLAEALAEEAPDSRPPPVPAAEPWRSTGEELVELTQATAAVYDTILRAVVAPQAILTILMGCKEEALQDRAAVEREVTRRFDDLPPPAAALR